MQAGRVRLKVLGALLGAIAVVITLAGSASAVSGGLVISQVYGGGGNSSATLKNDFIEVFNRGNAPVSLSGWSVQYAATTGTSWQRTNLTAVTLQPGQYYLVQEAQGAGGTVNLPTPDATGSIAMSASAGKVVLVNNQTTITSGTACPSGAAVVDIVGYGSGTTCFEGSGPTPTLSNTTAALRKNGGCVETDDSAADFATGAPDPRNTAASTHSCNGPTGVGAANPSSLPAGDSTLLTVAVTPGTDPPSTGLAVACNLSAIGGTSSQAFYDDGTHGDATSGNNTFSYQATVPAGTTVGTKTLPCTVSDAEARSNSAAITLTVEPPVSPIHDIQGSGHASPFAGQTVTTLGIVTAKRTNGFYLQDPSPDANDATSEGIFVFTSSTPTQSVGDSVRVVGTVQEFRPGGASSSNLSTTELTSPTTTLLSSGNPLPAATVVGTGGRIPPGAVIEDDATGDVETSGAFDPDTDGLDFWESLEGMRLQLNDAVAVGPTNSFGETSVVGDDGANASLRTARGGLLLRETDGNPERLVLDDQIVSNLPVVNVGDHYVGALQGVLDYNFGNFMLELTTMPTVTHDGISPESTTAQGTSQLSVATFNVENLDPTDPAEKFERLAGLIVDNLRSPDVISVEEVQDNDGPTDNGTVAANVTLDTLVAAIQGAGGPTYEYRQIDPVDDQDGGEPGGNIRQVFLFRTDRGLSFVDRPGGSSTNSTAVDGSGAATHLTYSPGRIDPTNSAFTTSRKPLAGEFLFNGHHLFVIANHFNSKGGDQPLMGRFQPPTRSSEVQRHQQAQIVNDFVDSILTRDPVANVVVDGDLNDFEFSDTVSILEGDPAVLSDLIETLPQNERYSYVFEGNSQTLDHVLVSGPVGERPIDFDVVHVNAEFADQASDHDPSVARITLNDPPTATFNAPASTYAGFDFALSLTSPSGPEPGDTFTYAFDCGNGYGTFGTSSTATCPTSDTGDLSVGGRIRDNLGAVTEYRATVHVVVTFDSLCALTRSYARYSDDADELCAILRDAEAASNPKTRSNLLKSFRKTVDGMTGTQAGKSFTQAQADELKLLSTRL